MNSGQQFQLPGWISCAPFEEYLGMQIEESGDGRAVLSMPFKVKLAQGVGLMHGGAITSLADTAVAMAIKSILPEGSDFVTVDLHLKFFAAVHEGTVRAVARAIPQDERKIVGEAEIFNGETKVAEFNAFFIVKRRGTT
ncbi:PaaI family thioesterase [Geomonas subterranea]|uniref:PaaI family thioesterase n=2 Tax=Geomonas subterranea TaxID=2847989 RepID=A0ABX8LMC2_9BACT|nr:PaaI family thioesterase [Geomonas subterranea]QXM11552.1 PaaI family thioesterase [Geomonas subterranea]